MEINIIMNTSEVLITTFLGPGIAATYWLIKQYIKKKDKIIRSKGWIYSPKKKSNSKS